MMGRAVTDTCSVDIRIPRYIMSVGWQGGDVGVYVDHSRLSVGKRLPMGHGEMFDHTHASVGNHAAV